MAGVAICCLTFWAGDWGALIAGVAITVSTIACVALPIVMEF